MISKPYLIVTDDSIEPSERIKRMSVYLSNKGYGDLNQEIKFISDFFISIFMNHNELTSFGWSQYQDYSDQGLHFDLESYKINDEISLDFSGFENAPSHIFDSSINLNYSLYSRDLNYSEYWNYVGIEAYSEIFNQYQLDSTPIKKVIDYILIFLKSIYEHHRPYYFIYLFGRRAKVNITAKGITINNDEIEYSNGNSNDTELNLDE